MAEKQREKAPKMSLEEQRKAIEKYEAYTTEMRKKESLSVTKTFKEIFKLQAEPNIVFVPELNCNIKYGYLTTADLLELDDIEDPVLLGQETLFRLWHNGDSTVSREEFDKMDIQVKSYISAAIMRKSPFLSREQLITSQQREGGVTSK